MNREAYSRTENTKDRWETPPYFFNRLNDIFGFTLDPAASHENHLCDKYYTIEEDGLKQDWQGETVFVNPPYSHIQEWVKKCYEEGIKYMTTVVLLIPVRSDTRYWHKYVMKATEIWLCKGRIAFYLDGKKMGSSTFPSAVIVFQLEDYHPRLHPFDHKQYEI